MNMRIADLRQILLQRLRPFFAPVGRGGEYPHGSQMFSYCAVDHERLLAVAPEYPIIGVVLRGAKEVWHGGQSQVFSPGTVFVFPRDVSLDIVNLPDERSGIYESLVLPVTSLPPQIRPRPLPRQFGTFSANLTVPLVESLAHAATAIAQTRHQGALAKLRLTELLLLLDSDPAGQVLACGDLTSRANWLVASRPAENWTVDQLAAELATAPSTLRRKLAASGQPFRQLLLHARMQAAEATIRAGGNVGEAAVAAGYSSRSHFSRAYQAAHGCTPAAHRRSFAAKTDRHVSG